MPSWEYDNRVRWGFIAFALLCAVALVIVMAVYSHG